jgi:hypothetical protein
MLRDSLQLSQLGQGVQNLIPQLQTIAEILPPPTLQWKLKLLEEGSRSAIPAGITSTLLEIKFL